MGGKLSYEAWLKPNMRRLVMRFTVVIVLAAATAYVGNFAFYAALEATNKHISRCDDESAPQYIVDRVERRRECGR